MSELDESLVPGESVLYRTGLHWSVLAGPVVLGTILVVAALSALVGSFNVPSDGWAPGALRISALGLAVVGAVAIGVGILRRSSVEMVVTNRRVLIKQGILSRRITELLISKVESIAVEQGITGRLTDFGRVIVRGTGGTLEVFERIARPLEFRRQVQLQIQPGPPPPDDRARAGTV